MESYQIRKKFFDFFATKEHRIIASDTMVIKNDPSLMFTNAGMNQFKDIFLAHRKPEYLRVANTQKCLRVSGKHNDLEEVGHDDYHHTMFEMLGNWSFGDYFKKEAIAWAWEFLTEILQIDKDRLYVTIFGGDDNLGIGEDIESKEIWKQFVDEKRIICGSKKDNFWEMGELGPCGPCSEIHVDIRDNDERQKIDAIELINKSHPFVIEIWNLVFIQYNRKADASLEPLPQKHVDTGMGLERLCMVMQNKKSSYETDIFKSLINKISEITNIKYNNNKSSDIAMKVIADHIRAISFAIADGQLPSNVKAGYVIRRILRRAVRYYYTYLNYNKPLIYRLVDTLCEKMGDNFKELNEQKNIIEKIIYEEENTFLNTLEKGIKIIDHIIEKNKTDNNLIISGKEAFTLYDTYGFPLDLTELIARENNLSVNHAEFDEAMLEQKNRARSSSNINTDDWIILADSDKAQFVGYDQFETKIKILKYRKVTQKNKDFYQLVFDKTPFYAESGGQVGDTGYIQDENEKINIIDTKNENNIIMHLTETLPSNINNTFNAVIDINKRNRTAINHSATHLLHYALRQVLGEHVIQKGSFVNYERFRFDFTYFQKMTDEELLKTENIINSLIRQNIVLEDFREMPIEEAKQMGAMALFGEKYGDKVRVVKFDSSIELCGGTHTSRTGNIGQIKIVSESAIAAGVRRIEAITAEAAQEYINDKIDTLSKISKLFNNPKDIIKSIEKNIDDTNNIKKQLQVFKTNEINRIKIQLLNNGETINNILIIRDVINVNESSDLRDIAIQFRSEKLNSIAILGSIIDGKPYLSLSFSDALLKQYDFNAPIILNEAAKLIDGAGGGQKFLALAGGKDSSKLDKAIKEIYQYVVNKIQLS